MTKDGLDYKKRKPDIETESVKGWVSEEDVECANEVLEDEKDKIEISCKNGFVFKLVGFNTFTSKKTGEIAMAYKLNDEEKVILIYLGDGVEEEEMEKIAAFVNLLECWAELQGYQIQDAKEFAERASVEMERVSRSRNESK